MLYIPDSWTMEIGFRVSIVCWIPDSLSWITDSNAQDSGFHQHWKISSIPENPDYFRSFNLPPITSTYCLRGVNDTFTVFLKILKEQRSVRMSKGPVFIYRRGEGWGGGGFGAKQGEI